MEKLTKKQIEEFTQASESAATEKKMRYKGFVRDGDILHGPITVKKRTFKIEDNSHSVISLHLPSGAVLEFGVGNNNQYLAELAEEAKRYNREPKEYS